MEIVSILRRSTQPVLLTANLEIIVIKGCRSWRIGNKRIIDHIVRESTLDTTNECVGDEYETTKLIKHECYELRSDGVNAVSKTIHLFAHSEELCIDSTDVAWESGDNVVVKLVDGIAVSLNKCSLLCD